jgi:hypothetical protein
MCVCSSFAQINISFDSNCLKYNSSIISKAMIEIFGEDSLKYWLDNNVNFVFISNVDSLGHILKIVKVRSQKPMQKDLVSLIEKYLIINRTKFFVCFAQDPLDINKHQIIDSVREQFKVNNSRLIASIAFPGELMSLYEYEKGKTKERNICLSKYDYLLIQIKKYLIE